MKIAVIGAGVSGLVTAYLLSRSHDVELFERNRYFGGHSHTVNVAAGSETLSLDTGFLVYNEPAYPRFSTLLDELGVATQPSDMSFSVTCEACNLAYSSRGLAGLLARPVGLLKPRNLQLARDILRFYREASRAVSDDAIQSLTLSQYLDARGYSGEFRRHFIVPLAAAVWSMPAEEIDQFPARYMLRFLYNHGLIGGGRERWRWRTVTGGSRSYVEAILARLGERAVFDTSVIALTRGDDGVTLTLARGGTRRYDAAVLACHADEALGILGDASSAEQQALEAFRYTTNHVVLHTDAALLPPEQAAWASWNYRTPDCRADTGLALTYHLNRLQSVPGDVQYCVSVNPQTPILRHAIIEEMTYTHPHYSFETLEAQRRVAALNGANRVYFAGAYLGYGFHEDGVESAHNVAAMLGVRA